VNHRGRNPFPIRIGSEPPFSLILDPRDIMRGHSVKSIQDELKRMLYLVTTRCEKILEMLAEKP